MYSFTSHVRFSEIDEDGFLSIPAIFNYLQDCSTFHSESLGFGPDHARESGFAWMISAWEVEILRRPAFNEPIRIFTWATSFKGARATRNFMICAADDEQGSNPFVRANSNWFIFSAEAGRPVRLPVEETAPYQPDIDNDTPLDMPAIPRKLVVEGEGASAAPVVVSGAHLDTNHHVNNSQYVSLALGAVDELGGMQQAGGSLWIDVHYNQAAKLGDTIYPHVYRGGEGTTVTLDNAEGKPFAAVRLHA